MIEPIPNLNREKTRIKLILKINEIIEHLNKTEACLNGHPKKDI